LVIKEMVFPSLSWYLVITLLGWVTFPLIYRLLPALHDRGYAFSRALGLLLWTYAFWLLGSLGVLSNDLSGILFGFILLLALAYWSWRKIPEGELRSWITENSKTIIAVESLFAVAFIGIILLRGMYPAIIGTEKPMELAFINAILRSPSMPPHDPWLADYAISYYYFGYVMVAMLAQVTGISGSVAFNLGISIIFAMTAVGAYGVVHNLLAATRPTQKIRNAIYSLLGPLFVLIVSNVEGFLEYLHGQGWGWAQDANGEWFSSFWTNLGIENLVNSPQNNTLPGEHRHWWWWRASRVIQDYGFSGNEQEVIDEFPFFSYYLADLHPHVLVMPFVFLAIALTLNMFLSKRNEHIRIFGFEFEISRETFLLGAILFGGLSFLNIWDFPWQVGLFAAVHMVRRAQAHGWGGMRFIEFLTMSIAFGLVGVVAYLPFYISFSSQAGGILPNLINPSDEAQLWVMFGTLFVPLFFFLIYANISKKAWRTWAKGLITGVGVTLTFFGFSLLLAYLIISIIPTLRLFNPEVASAGDHFLGMYGAENLSQILEMGFARRQETLPGILVLTLLIGLALGALWPRNDSRENEQASTPVTTSPSAIFALVLILFGGLLIIIPEFVFLRDQFNTRMNTIFKFYFQAWMFWGLAAAYGSAILLGKPRRSPWPWVYSVILVSTLTIGLTYPLMAVETQWNKFTLKSENTLQLDGAVDFALSSPEDKAAAAWLKAAPLGTLVEAVGGSYTHYARIATYSGQPSLLGWPGHESQWRGGGAEMGTRAHDIERLYTTGSWAEANQIITWYGIRYIYLGSLERTTYNVNEGKFNRNLEPVYQVGQVTIYEVPELQFPTSRNE
jgi:YYY domain-containing protein